MEAILTVWVIAWRSVWPLMLLFAAITAYDLIWPRSRGGDPVSPRRGLVLLLWFGPLLLCVWGGANWAAEQSSVPESVHWRSWILTGLAISSIASAVWMPYRLRERMRWPHLVGPVLSVLLAIVFWGMGTMALSNVWL